MRVLISGAKMLTEISRWYVIFASSGPESAVLNKLWRALKFEHGPRADQATAEIGRLKLRGVQARDSRLTWLKKRG